MNRKGEIGKKLGIGLSVIFTVFWLIPYIYVICCSFKPGSEVIAVPPSFFPKAFSIENFVYEDDTYFKYCSSDLRTNL